MDWQVAYWIVTAFELLLLVGVSVTCERRYRDGNGRIRA